MKTLTQRLSVLILVSGFSLGGNVVWAQNTYGGAPQKGKGAYVQKEAQEITRCLPNSLLGVPAMSSTDCVTMTREKLVATPSGKATIVWRGTVPVNARPAQRTEFTSTYVEEYYTETLGRHYNTVAITEPNGSITLTLKEKSKEGYGKKHGVK